MLRDRRDARLLVGAFVTETVLHEITVSHTIDCVAPRLHALALRLKSPDVVGKQELHPLAANFDTVGWL